MPIKFLKNCTCNFASSSSQCIANLRGTSLQVCTVKSDCWCNLELCVYYLYRNVFLEKSKIHWNWWLSNMGTGKKRFPVARVGCIKNTMKNACKS